MLLPASHLPCQCLLFWEPRGKPFGGSLGDAGCGASALRTQNRAKESRNVTDNKQASDSLSRDSRAQSCLTLCDPLYCSPPGSSAHGISQARTLEWGCHFLLQGIFLTQRSNSVSCIGRQVFLPLSHEGSHYKLDGL